MKKPEVKKISCCCPFRMEKKAKNRSTVNIAVSRCCPQFYMAVSQISPLLIIVASHLK
jgi:hypothetical protein